jgi:voltage-gated potassium channel
MDHARKLKLAAGLLVLLVVSGVIGYRTLGGPQWTFVDCLYMTVITLTTVGYGETHDMANQPAMRVFTMCLLLTGFATTAYAFTTLTSFIVEGELNTMLKRRRMSKGITDLKDHFIVCGMGETGHHVVDELRRTRRDFICVDVNTQRIERLLTTEDFLHIEDDATDDDTLLRAGILRAAGLVACLANDKDNLYVTLTARQLNPGLRIVAKAIDVKVVPKLQKAGADAVVSPQAIGGLRLVSELIRPHVVGFLDNMIRDSKVTIRIEEVVITPGCPLAGSTVQASEIRQKTGLLILAIKDPANTQYQYNPAATTHLKVGATLVVLGEVSQIQALRRIAGPQCVEDEIVS